MSAKRPEGATSVHTEAVTQRVKDSDRNNSTAKRLRLVTLRSDWLDELKRLTAMVREQRADRLEVRGRVLAADRWTDWTQSGLVARAERTGRSLEGPAFERIDKANDIGEAAPLASGTHLEAPADHPALPPGVRSYKRRMRLGATRWHASRAKNKRELFERVAACGKAEAHAVTLVCRDCGDATEIQVGCSSHWFCHKCRARTAQRFRSDFSRKRMGLITTAARAGLTRRRQKREARWGERFLTLTLPPVGGVRTRIQTVRATWARFWRTLQDELRGTLNGPSGIILDDLPAAKDRDGLKLGAKEDPNRELSLYEVLSYLHVLEWTPGNVDGQGHPHLHVWLFSPYLEQAMLERLWREAFAHVTDQDAETVAKTIVHIEAAKDGIEHELIKYLTKDWEMHPDGARRVSPEVFAQVYAELDGKRLRQSSSRFGRWAVAKARFCPCCGFENERGHWARVDIEHALDHHKAPIGVHRDPAEWNAWLARMLAEHERSPVLLTAADLVAFEGSLSKRDDAWADSIERAIVRGQMRKAFAGEPMGRFVVGAEAKRLGLADGAYVASPPPAPPAPPRGLLVLTAEALAWTREQARPELVELISSTVALQVAQARRDRRPADADSLCSELLYAWSRFLSWHVANAMALCYERAGSEAEAVAVFRNEEVNAELRQQVARMTRELFERK